MRGEAPSWAPEDDEIEVELVEPRRSKVPSGPLQSIAGVCVEILYRDAKGREASRRITCRRLELTKGVQYIYAFCHEREAYRSFRADRVLEVVDLETGECIACDEFLSEYDPNIVQESAKCWGLSVQRKNDLWAALKVLVFMSACDRERHDAETEEIEAFIDEYWEAVAAKGEPPVDDIMAAVERLRPDAESFILALQHCASKAGLAPLLMEACGRVVDADGKLAGEEVHWSRSVEEYLQAA